MKPIKRVPIIRRIPIVVGNQAFSTIVSSSRNYNNYTVLNTYPSLELARQNYQDDIRDYTALAGNGVLNNFGIIPATIEKGESYAKI